VAVVFIAAALIVQRLFSTRRPSEEKSLPYECGEDPVGTPWVQFNIRFYAFALAFLVFDVEVVFLLPWAVAYRGLDTQAMRWVGFADGVLFVAILFVGLVWAWARGHLEWVKPRLPSAGGGRSAPGTGRGGAG
jgi:NADH-quinone oxidoreductase subunit A